MSVIVKANFMLGGDEVTIERDESLVFDLYFEQQSPELDVQSVEISSDVSDMAGESISILFEENCLPDFPVYLRWINRLGGYEYWMFSGRKTFRDDVKRGESYRLGDGQRIDSTATRGELPPTVDSTISCGAEQLDEDDFRLLKGIFLSPYVEKYNEERGLFERVILKDSNAEWDTANSRGVIDLEFSVIDQPIQF